MPTKIETKERPILFTSEMVRAVLEGRKTQTRRVCKDQTATGYEWLENCEMYPSTLGETYTGWAKNCGHSFLLPTKCPYGGVGDRLWVRETHYRYGKWVKNGISKTGRQKWRFKGSLTKIRYIDEGVRGRIRKNIYRKEGWYKRPSIFMPKWAARIWLEITNIRVEKLQNMRFSDWLADFCPNTNQQNKALQTFIGMQNQKEMSQEFWDTINAKHGYSWESNPYVWVIEFKQIRSKLCRQKSSGQMKSWK